MSCEPWRAFRFGPCRGCRGAELDGVSQRALRVQPELSSRPLRRGTHRRSRRWTGVRGEGRRCTPSGRGPLNDSGYTAATYQDYIARHSYGQYQIGYRRLGKTWFVLSGEGNGRIFYEKVMFTCAGRLINSFAMIYPFDQRHLFDPVVERIED